MGSGDIRRPKLIIPMKPGEGERGVQDIADEQYLLPAIKQVMDYSRLNYFEVMELPFDLFLLMKKHAFIDKMNETEEGRQYLKDCERLKKTKPDYSALKELPGYRAEVVQHGSRG